jgi:hypothetical protein
VPTAQMRSKRLTAPTVMPPSAALISHSAMSTLHDGPASRRVACRTPSSWPVQGSVMEPPPGAGLPLPRDIPGGPGCPQRSSVIPGASSSPCFLSTLSLYYWLCPCIPPGPPPRMGESDSGKRCVRGLSVADVRNARARHESSNFRPWTDPLSSRHRRFSHTADTGPPGLTSCGGRAKSSTSPARRSGGCSSLSEPRIGAGRSLGLLSASAATGRLSSGPVFETAARRVVDV